MWCSSRREKVPPSPVLAESVVRDHLAQFVRGRDVEQKAAALAQTARDATEKGRHVLRGDIIEAVVDAQREVRFAAEQADAAGIRKDVLRTHAFLAGKRLRGGEHLFAAVVPDHGKAQPRKGTRERAAAAADIQPAPARHAGGAQPPI